MAKNKFYAVKKGKVPGVYLSWNEAKENIEGFSGAEYKGFSNLDDAYDFMGNNKKQDNTSKDIDEEVLKVYTDGSFCLSNNSIGFGVVFVKDDKELFSDCGKVPTNNTTEANVTGEIYAVIRAINLAIANNFKEICICHDYEGLAKFIEGGYTANKPLTKRYIEYVEKHSDKVKVHFKHVKGHSNNKWNCKADTLASIGCYL